MLNVYTYVSIHPQISVILRQHLRTRTKTINIAETDLLNFCYACFSFLSWLVGCPPCGLLTHSIWPDSSPTYYALGRARLGYPLFRPQKFCRNFGFPSKFRNILVFHEIIPTEYITRNYSDGIIPTELNYEEFFRRISVKPLELYLTAGAALINKLKYRILYKLCQNSLMRNFGQIAWYGMSSFRRNSMFRGIPNHRNPQKGNSGERNSSGIIQDCVTNCEGIPLDNLIFLIRLLS